MPTFNGLSILNLSFCFSAFITGLIQESLIMNQANGQAKLEIMSIVFNFTIAHVENV